MPSRQSESTPNVLQKKHRRSWRLRGHPTDTTATSPERSSTAASQDDSPSDGPTRTLSPTSPSTMNSLKLLAPSSKTSTSATATPTRNKSQPDTYDGASNSRERGASDPRVSSNGKVNVTSPPGLSHGENSNTVRASTASALPPSSFTSVRALSSEFKNTKIVSGGFPIAEDGTASADTSANNNQWSSAVGKANLGKSGRVIEKLMGENDMLKRDLNLERLKAEESRSAVKMTEQRMETMTADYETRLHEAAINKTLLKRRERQVTELKGQVNTEKTRADNAVESERTWREALDKTERDSKVQVEDAVTQALLMEGRVQTMENHWKDKGAKFDRAVSILREEMKQVVEECQVNVERIQVLNELCDQQETLFTNLQAEKKAIADNFAEYKKVQDALLEGIKARAMEQERKNEETLAETKKALHELKWALGVHKAARPTK